MAQTARYASRSATFGSVAYDLDALKRGFETTGYAEPEPERAAPAAAPGRVSRPDAVERVGAWAKARAIAVQSSPVTVSVFSVLGFLLAAVLIVFVILSYVQITELNDQKTQLRAQVSALDMEMEQLRVGYETTFNLNEIEDYASHTLGMVRLTDSNTAAVRSGRTDAGVVLSPMGDDGSAFSGFGEFIGSLLEYLK